MVDVRFPDSLTTAEVGRENVQNGFWKPWCGCDPDGHCIECVCDYEWACPAVTTTTTAESVTDSDDNTTTEEPDTDIPRITDPTGYETLFGLVGFERQAIACRATPNVFSYPTGENVGLTCQVSTRAVNSEADWEISGNGIPDHAAHSGASPGTIQDQDYSYYFPKTAVYVNDVTATSQQLPMGVIGVAKNGVLIQSWASAGCCDVGEEELEELDSCNGHPVADSGRYHYHLWPRCLQSCENGVGGTQAGFIGVALDGFPIY